MDVKLTGTTVLPNAKRLIRITVTTEQRLSAAARPMQPVRISLIVHQRFKAGPANPVMKNQETVASKLVQTVARLVQQQ